MRNYHYRLFVWAGILLMKAAHRRYLLGSTALVTVMTVVVADGAQAQQAVAYPNGTFGGFAGSKDGSGFASALGSWTTPLGPMVGGQIDGYAGVLDGQFMGQVAGHLFWRKPDTALYGLYTAWTQQFGQSAFRIGPEAEIYAGQFTLSGVGGVKTGDGDTTGFFQGKISYYATPDTKFYGGGGYDDTGFGMVGVEHMFASTGLAGFAEARFGETTSAWAGLRFYFGAPGKSLESRDREDVAPLWMHMVKEPPTQAGTTVAPTTTPTPTTTNT